MLHCVQNLSLIEPSHESIRKCFEQRFSYEHKTTCQGNCYFQSGVGDELGWRYILSSQHCPYQYVSDPAYGSVHPSGGSRFSKEIKGFLKNPERALSAIEKFSRNANRYLVIKTLISATIGVVIWLWLLIIGVDSPLLWGMLSFLLNYVPDIGSIIAALPVALLALVRLGVGSALLTILGFVVVHIVVGNIIEPKLMGKGLSLSTLVVFLSMVFWGWVLGPIGMILSVPMTSLVKIALESYEETRGLAIMLGSGTEIE
ncbi:MAG: AI-2E family transporter [Desulfobacterales bacterium]